MRGVEMAERAEGFEDRGREREREGAEIFAGRPAEDEGFAVDGLAVGEAVDGELAPGRVLEELKERSALLLDEGEEDGRGVAGSSAKRTARRSGSAGSRAPSATSRPSSSPRRHGIAHAGDARTSAGDQSRKGGRAERMSREFMSLRSELKG